jgi:predicted GNAT superfamily acetyltransferase
MKATILYRPLSSVNEIRKVVRLQESVWGQETITSLTQMVAAIHHGGCVIGAFDGERLVGFCYGFPGFRNGQAYLVSHMLAIEPEYRDQGIGFRLKLEQRTWALAQGYPVITWTFDPLETRNAYLNLSKLGGYARTYQEDYYGELSGELNRGLPTDRFVVEWELNSPRVLEAIAGDRHDANDPGDEDLVKERLERVTILNVSPGASHPVPLDRIEIPDQAKEFLLPIPRNIHTIKKENMELARQWRFAVRHVAKEAFTRGYRAVALLHSNGPVESYVFRKEEDEDN